MQDYLLWATLATTQTTLNRLCVELLIADPELAMTFLDRASNSSERETKDRNCRNARTAYDTVRRLRPRFTETEAQRVAIDERLAIVKERLNAVGEQV